MSDSMTNLFKPFDEIEWMTGECFEIVRRERESRLSAEKANRRKDEFLAVVAHELRNTLNSIGGWLALLSSGKLGETDDDDDASRAVEAIRRGLRLQTKLVEDLMDASQINSGTFQLNLRETEIAPIIDSVVRDFEVLAAARQIRIESSLSSNLGTLTADGERLAQVMSNLLSNALKFTPLKGRISITTKRTPRFVELRVIDTGQGIAAEFLPLIFDPYSQSESSGNVNQKGLGLGLSIVRQIIALHGGSVSAQSAGRDQGATFTIQIPHNLSAATKAKDRFRNKSKNLLFAAVSK